VVPADRRPVLAATLGEEQFVSIGSLVPVSMVELALCSSPRVCSSGLATIQGSSVMTLFVPFGNDGGQGALSGR
jgi:hypothetical protein